MARVLFVNFILISCLIGCEEDGREMQEHQVLDWSVKLDSPSEIAVAKIGGTIYDGLYQGRAIMYAEFGTWDVIHVHGYTPRTKTEIETFSREYFRKDITIEYGNKFFPKEFASYAKCNSSDCAVVAQCSRTFHSKNADPLDVTEKLAGLALGRGYPVAGVFYKGESEEHIVVLPFYKDCDKADDMALTLCSEYKKSITYVKRNKRNRIHDVFCENINNG